MEAPGALVMVEARRPGKMRATPRSAILATIGLVQENVSGRQVAVDDGRRVAVQERQPAGHVVKDGAFQRDGDEGLGRRRRLEIKNVVETGRQLLHDQRRHPRAWQETHAQELDNVRVAKGAHQLTLSHELVRRFLDAFARHLPRVLEKVVDLLGGAHGSRNGHLLHAAVRARPDSPARGASGGEEERTEVGMVAEERLRQGLGSHCAAVLLASRSQAFSGPEKCLRATCSSGMCWSRYHEPQYHNIA